MVKDGQEANGKSIMGLLTLVAAHGVTMTVVCEGDDADAAVAALAELVGDGLRRGGRSLMEQPDRGGRVARASRSASRTCSASRVEIHERRIAAEQVDAEIARFEKALFETDAQLARIQAADRRARGRRAAVPDPRGPPADAVATSTWSSGRGA